MRFPDIPWMKPVMDLFTELELDKVKIPYILSTDENLNFFNGKSLTNAGVKISAQEGKYDPFNTKVTGINGTVDDMVTRQIEPFRNALKVDFDKGFEALMKYDAWSTRGYMRLHGTAPHGSYDDQVRFALTASLTLWTDTTCVDRSSPTWRPLAHQRAFTTRHSPKPS